MPPNFDLCRNICPGMDHFVYFNFYVIRSEIDQGSVLPGLNDTLDYLSWINFRMYLFSRGLIFPWTNFREWHFQIFRVD